MGNKTIDRMMQGSNLLSWLQVDDPAADKRNRVVQRSGLGMVLSPVVADYLSESAGDVVWLLMSDREVVMHIVGLGVVGMGIAGWS